MKTLSLLVASVATLSCLCAAGCASTSGDDAAQTAEALGQSIDVPNPSGTYFASVSANGTGCPVGSWQAAISDDGTAFTLTFSQYEAIVQPGQAFSAKDCSIAINLKTPSGFSFAVSSFHYQGYANLDRPGMTARQSAKYYFQGNPTPANEQRADMNGPYDSSYVFSDDVGITDMVWSPCGAQRTLNAQTRLIVQNDGQKSGSGYLNTSSVDGEVKMRFGLSWKQCGGNGSSGAGSSSGWPGSSSGGGSSSGWPGGGSSGGGSSSGWPGSSSGGGSSSGWPGSSSGGSSGGGVPSCGVLRSNESLYKNQSITSCDGRTQLVHQYDGQILLVHDGRQLWRNGVTDPSSDRLTMQQDGHLVEWSSNGRELWYSQAGAGFGAYLSVQNDCNAVVHDQAGTVLWQTRTFCQ